MSDEYSVHNNFQRASGDSRAQGEFEHRMGRVRQRDAEREAVWIFPSSSVNADVALDDRARMVFSRVFGKEREL